MSVVGALGLLEKLLGTAVKFPGERRCFATVDPRAEGIRVFNLFSRTLRVYAFAFNQ